MRIIFTGLILSALWAATSLAAPFAYITNTNSGDVSVIDVATNIVIKTISTGQSPFGVAASPNGEFVYVADFSDNNISVIRTSINAVVDTVPVGFFPNNLDSNVSVIQTSTA